MFIIKQPSLSIIRTILSFILLLDCTISKGQEANISPVLLKGLWSSAWITYPNAAQRDYGVYHFRKTFNLSTKPDKFVIHVSADNRYRLFVNGKAVCSGPARGDLYNWYYETIDISSYLKSGDNVIAALVWNMGTLAPVAQISNQTGFLLQGNTDAEKVVNSNSSWKAFENKAYTPCSTDNGSRLGGVYMVIGPGDQVDASIYPWGWEQANYNDNDWKSAKQIARPSPIGYGTDNLWTLKPRTIPLMEETLQRIPEVRRSKGLQVSNAFLTGKQALTIPANKTVSILLDQTFNTTAYPELVVSGGKGSSIKLMYAEALFKGKDKGNRNEIEGKELIGNYDVFQPDGSKNRLFRPLWLRTYRYMQVDITTKEEPLIIEDLYGMYTGYPFKEKASFSSNDRSLQEIWKVGWRTARLCAGETYYDCPYYEQLQYEGDTRIQALISLYVSGDDRLMRKAITDFHNSRVPEGLTQGRYPSNRLQVIPPFSLYWVSMVYDYWMHRKDDAFIREYLSGIKGVLAWYENQIDQEKKMLGPMKWWNFVDYTSAFKSGVPEGATNGNSSIITLQYVYTLQQAFEIFKYFNKKDEADHYKNLAEVLSQNTYRQCFDKEKGLMSNTPDKNVFSQHAGIMAILTGTISEADERAVMQNILTDKSIGQATFYYRFYLTQALKKVGMADRYYSELTPWRDMLKIGLTTFAEKPEPARSDCHAWSASPNYDFLATICGIMPDSPGFRSVLIKPALGELNEVRGSIPHPEGEIKVSFKTRKQGSQLTGEITLPENISGKLIWQNKEIQLKGGKQEIKL